MRFANGVCVSLVALQGMTARLLLSAMAFSLLSAVCRSYNSGRSSSFAIDPDETTKNPSCTTRFHGVEPGSGYLLLGNGLDAFVARAVLANLAEKTSNPRLSAAQ